MGGQKKAYLLWPHFGSLLVICLGDIDIDEGASWSRVALQLMTKSSYNMNTILPRVVSCFLCWRAQRIDYCLSFQYIVIT